MIKILMFKVSTILTELNIFQGRKQKVVTSTQYQLRFGNNRAGRGIVMKTVASATISYSELT